MFLKEISSEFKIVSKKALYFLRLEIEYMNGNIKISQKSYARKILERFNFLDCKISTPMIKDGEVTESGKDILKKT